MSAVSNDSGGGLYTLVEAQRGMSPTEIFNFLTTGEVPDLSQPPKEDVDSDESELYTPTDEDVMALLSGTSVTASASLFSQQSHHNDLINDEVIYHDDDVVAAGKKRKWKAEQHPRDRRGRFIEKGAVVDLLSAKKPTIQHLLSAVKELDQAHWDKLTDAQQEHIAEHVDRLPSGAGPATTSMKEKLAKLTSVTTTTTTANEDVKTPSVKSSDDDKTVATPVGGSSLTPAVIYKKHADGAVIAESADGTQRMRWDATRKKFIVESRDTTGSWSETDQLTKTNAYADVKIPGKWFEPGTAKIEDQISPVSSSQTSENALPDSQPTGKTDPTGSQIKPTKKLTADERAALKTWSGPGYKKISNALRAGETTPEVSLIDSAIAKNTLPEMTLYRSLVTTPNFNPSDVLKAGTVFTDANFLATSSKHPSGTLFENYHTVTIKVPNGANGVKVSGPYDEVLLPRNSKLFIDKVDQNRTVLGTTAPIYDFYATLVIDDDIKPDVDVNVVDGVSPDSYLVDKTDTAKSQVKPYSYVTGNDVEDVAKQNIDDWQRTMYDTGGTGEDAILKKIAEAQGWDKLPRTGTKEELDAAIAAGGTASYRGVTGGDEKALFKDAAAAKGLSASEILDRFREGPLYYGTGIYGNGIYTAERHDKALNYAGGSEDGVVRVVISPDAKMIDDETLHDEYVAWLNTIPKFSPMATVFSDPNRYAAMRGYDVVTMESPVGGRFNVILNRSALLIEKPNSSQSNDQLVDAVTPTPPLTPAVTTPVAEVTAPDSPAPTSATTKTLITPTKAIYAKGIANDDVVAESATGDRRIRWSEGRKRFVDETRGVNGEWSETEALNKSATYAKLKSQPNSWYIPDVAQAQTDDVAINDPVDLRVVSSPVESTVDADIDVPAVVTPGTDTAQRISDINSEIAGILAMNRNNLDEYKRLSDKAKKGKALSSAELSAFNGSLFAVAQSVNAQVRELVNEKLDIIAKSDDSPFGSVTQPNASRWEIPRKPSAAIAGGVTADMKKTRDEYVMDDVKTLKNNASLRSTSPSAAAKSWRDRVNSWVNASTITNDATVYRGSALTPEQIMNIRPGMIMSDPGIMSTDEDLDNANFYADRRLEFTPGTLKTMFTINVPKGASGANASYGEYVFGSNTPLRIIATERVGNDVHVRAEIVSSDDDNVSTPALADVSTPTPTSTDSSLSASGGTYTGPSLQIPSAITPSIVDEYMTLETRRLATNNGYGDGDLTDDEVKRLWALSDEIRENGDTATLANLEQRAIISRPFAEWRKVVGLENTPEDDVKTRVAARMREVLADKKIGIRVTPNTLQNIINDGRIKTQFETNTSSGANAPIYRAGYEAAWFGIGQGLDPAEAALVDKEKRPIYGYVMTDGVRPIGRDIGTESVSATTDILNHYGKVQIILKDDVRDRTTITVGDSLDGRNRTMPSPMNNPEWYSFGPSTGLPWEPPTSLDSDLTESRLRHNSYVEAQIHNGVSTDDIDEVIFPKKPSSDVINQLDSRGISWRVLRDNDVDDLTLDQRNAARKRLLDDIAMYDRKLAQVDELLAKTPGETYTNDKKKINAEIIRLQGILAKLRDTDNSSLSTSSQNSSVADQLRASYDNGYTIDEKLSGGDVALSVERITLADGKRAVRKRSEMMQETRKEVLSGAIAEALGLDNVTTVQLDDHTTIAEFVDGTVGSRFIREKNDELASDPSNSGLSESQLEKLARATAHEAIGSKQIALLDFLTNNGDRHGGNFIVRPDGSVRPIDHGSVLFDSGSTDPLRPDDSFWIESPFVETWLRPERDKNRKLTSLNPRLTSDDIVGLRERLMQLKPLFDQPDEKVWFNGMMLRLIIIESAVNQ